LHLDLFGRLALYSTLQPQHRERLLLASVYNDLRLIEDSPPGRRRRAISLLDYAREHSKPGGRLAIAGSISRAVWREALVAASEQLLTTPGFRPYERSVALNLWLAREGMCPLVHYAFERWFEVGSYGRSLPSDIVDDLADLSTTFLYRLVPVSQAPLPLARIGTGAYTNVYRSADGGTAIKVPRNLAAKSFANHAEHEASLYAAASELASFIPGHLGFDPGTGIIEREFIPGPMGVDLLTTASFRDSPFAMDQLEHIYKAACGIYQADGINFDIHPGNIKWDDRNSRWVLVDLGPMPTIGADYFPRDSFQRYFQKIWLDLHYLMKTVPIRSLDIEVPSDGDS
jgi:hypothetical protein